MDKENIKKGAFLKTLRESKGYSERDVAELVGVEPSDITVWETGIKFPDQDVIIEKLARIFNVSKKELINGEYSKKGKEVERYAELDYTEDDSEDREAMNSIKKTAFLVILSCFVLFIFIVTIASLTKKPNTVSDGNDYYVASDVREPIVHTPHVKNEHIIYNTVVANPNTEIDHTSDLLNYGFVYQDGKYVKNGKNYTVEYYNSTFRITVNEDYKTSYAEMSIYRKSIKHTTITKTKTIELTITPPDEMIDCDSTTCSSNSDYYKYLNLLVSIIRG